MNKYLLILVGFLVFVGQVHAQNRGFLLDLSVGSRGQDVVELQSWLIARGYDIPSITSGTSGKGYFGQQTKNALAAFQRTAGVPDTGILGPVTRERMNAGSFYPTIPSYPTYPGYPTTPQYSGLAITGIEGPTSLAVYQSGTWTVRVNTAYSDIISYVIDWGDNTPLGVSGLAQSYSTSQSKTFSHDYSQAGTYIIRVTVRNSAGLSSQSALTVQIQGVSGAGSLRVVSPNGGENWQRGTYQNITWTSPYYIRATSAELRLVRACTGICTLIYTPPYVLVSGISINQNSYSWLVGRDANGNSIPDGQYAAQVCEIGTTNCDASDAAFTIGVTNSYPYVAGCPAGYVCRPY